MRLWKLQISGILFLCCSSNAVAQLDSISNFRLVETLNAVSETRAAENIYLQTDRDIYENDQDIWFKSYVLDNQLLTLSDASEILFLQLIREEGKEVVLEEKYEIINGIAQGHLYLPNTLKEGHYFLVGHTVNSILDGAREIQSLKPIQIKESVIPVIIADVEFDKKNYNKGDNINLSLSLYSPSRTALEGATIKATLFDIHKKKIAKVRTTSDEEGEAEISFLPKDSKKVNTIEINVSHKAKTISSIYAIPTLTSGDIQFGLYPEGGELIAHINNNIAFKAVDRLGNPQVVSGTLYENNKEVLHFESMHQGMGKFNFSPSLEHNYHIKITKPKIDSIFSLPKIIPQGIVLQLENYGKEHITFKLNNTTGRKGENIYIRAQLRGITYWVARGMLSSEETYFKMPLDKIPQGIMEVTVFDNTHKPIAERLIYANPEQKLYIERLTEISKVYGKKKKVSLSYKITDQKGQPVKSNLGLSVYSHLYKDEAYAKTIQTYHYLSGVLKGKIHNPGFYFNEKNKNRLESLDVLLLTQGWRNYQWNESNLRKNARIAVQNKMSEDISGRIYMQDEKGLLKETGETEVHIISSQTIKTIKSDAFGTINLSKQYFKLLKGQNLLMKPSGDNLILKMTSHFDHINKVMDSRTFPVGPREITINNTRKTKFNSDFSFDGMNFLEEVELTGHTKHKRHNIFETQFSHAGSIGDYVCVQFGILNCINHRSGVIPNDGQVYSLNNGRRVRYKAPPEINEKERNEKFGSIKGYYPNKEFYSPNYDKREDAVFPDYRKTLLWEPNLIPNEKGEITISFYTSDIGSTFIGEFEGIGSNGLLGYEAFEFRVE